MNRSQSPINSSSRNASGSKRYVSPNERQNTQESDQRKIQQLLGQQVQSKVMQGSEQSSFVGVDNSKVSNMTQFANYMYVPCPTHPEFFITNMCSDPNCIEPLCPECIPSHLEQHQSKGKVPKFENIQRVRKDNTFRIDELSKQLQFKLQDTKKYFQEAPLKIYNHNLQELRSIHEQVSNIIDDYFEVLYKELKETNQELVGSVLTELDAQIQTQQQKLLKLQEALHNDQYVRAIIQICDQRDELFTERHLHSLDKLVQDFQQQQVKVVFEKGNLDMMSAYCKKICYFIKNTVQPQPIFQKPIQSIKKIETPTPTDSFKQLSALVQSDLPPAIKTTSLIAETLTDEEKQCSFNIKNHFSDDQDQVIVRLEEGGYAAYLYDLKTKKYKVETIISPIRVPLFHKLYTTTFGKHLIIGGIDRDKSRFKGIAQVYEFNHTTLQMTLHSEMILPRAMASACQIDNWLYVVGGSQTNDENNSMAKAERLDLTTRKWYSIEDPYHKVSGCALVSINETTLLKIGGKSDIFTPCNSIETYDTKKNQWTKLEFKFLSTGYLRLPFICCCALISYDQILIVGGSIHDVKSDETQVLNLKDKTIQKFKQLPLSIEFPTQNAIVQQNNLYVLTENDQPLLIGNSQGFKLIL